MREPVLFGSVCSGIEAASVAWEELGWRAAWLAEIEDNPSKILKHHYPKVPNLGDMTRIPRLLRGGEIYPPDVLCGGTPCQAFSLAGLRNSLDDARGNLSLTFCEIANELDIQRAANGLLPATIVWENVPGVLSTKDNAFGHFLAGLAGEDCALVPPGKKWSDAGCVYGPQRVVAWRVLDAQFFGLAQRRKRVFVVASARNGFDPAAILFEPESLRRHSPPRRGEGQDTAGTLAARTDGGGFPGTDEACSGYIQPVACGGVDLRNGAITGEVAHTLQAGAHAPDPGGTPHVLAPIAFDSRQDCVSSTEVFGSLSSSTPQAQAVSYAIQAGALRTNPNSGPNGVGVQADIAYTLEARAEVQAVAMTLEASAGRSRGAGTPIGMLAAVRVTGDITHTLKAEGFDANEDVTGRGQPIVAAFAENTRAEVRYEGGDGSRTGALSTGGGKPGQGTPTVQIGMAVRRLTPRECERLQGFPDDYTAIPLPDRRQDSRGDRREAPRVMADGPRYKALGNSWAIPVVRWIGRRIDAHLRKLDAA